MNSKIILGSGLAGLSLSYFLKEKSIILEKEKQIGGLCRSFEFNGIFHDIGPHILFSKNKRVLSFVNSLADASKIRRSNKIFHKGRLIKYPFENDLASLSKEDRDYCLKEFLKNSYRSYNFHNMLQFFLKIYGEGITKLYLQPYNEKIWKFDPSFMDTQMVERIPKPPKEDVIKSAKGIETEGYIHQLYFNYPKKGGIQEIINNLTKKVAEKSKIINSIRIKRIYRKKRFWNIETNKGNFKSETLINCIPLHELFRYIKAPKNILTALSNLKYNSIYITTISVKKDNIGNNFSLYFADPDVIFHRVSKLNFLGPNYSPKDKNTVLLVEVTYRPKSFLSTLSKDKIKRKILRDLDRLKIINKKDVTNINCKSFKYAYVIYDLDHRRNVDLILKYLSRMEILCCGRFAEFEYLNMDRVIEHSRKLAKKLNKK